MNQVVNIPNRKFTTSSFKGKTPDSLVLSKKPGDAHVFKNLHSVSLISLGQLYDDKCTTILDKNAFMLSKVLIQFIRKKKPNGWIVGHTFNYPSPIDFNCSIISFVTLDYS